MFRCCPDLAQKKVEDLQGFPFELWSVQKNLKPGLYVALINLKLGEGAFIVGGLVMISGRHQLLASLTFART